MKSQLFYTLSSVALSAAIFALAAPASAQGRRPSVATDRPRQTTQQAPSSSRPERSVTTTPSRPSSNRPSYSAPAGGNDRPSGNHGSGNNGGGRNFGNDNKGYQNQRPNANPGRPQNNTNYNDRNSYQPTQQHDRSGNRPGGNNGNVNPGGNRGSNNGNVNPGGNRGSNNGSNYRPDNNSNNYRPGGNGGNNRPGGNGGNYRPGDNRPGGNAGHYRPGDNRPGGNAGHYRPGDNRPSAGGPRPHHGGINHGGPRPDYGRYRWHSDIRPRGPRDRWYDYYRYNRWSWHAPIAPPYRQWRPTIVWYYRPIIPTGYRYYASAPIISGVLGLEFGTFLDASLNFLYYNGYEIDGYKDNVVYLRDVNMMGYSWPDVMLQYDTNGGMYYAEFVTSTSYQDDYRFRSLYNSLCSTYGTPINSGNGHFSWYGNNGSGFVNLNTMYDGGRYFTVLTFGT